MTVVALDIGGTNIRAARVDADGTILARRVAPTTREPALDALVAELADEQVAAIGVGVTGPVVDGVVENPHTLPGWEGLDLRAALRSFGVPVVVDNDANAAALGEWWLGGRASRLAMVTFGTGIGVGSVVDGVVQRGPAGVHGEAGHMVLDPAGPPCYCGARGCWEQLAAGPALPRLAASAGLDVATGAELTALARAGDPRALEAFAELGRWIGLGLLNLTAVFAPDVIVLGGGLGAEHDLFAASMTAAMANAMVPTASVRVRPAAHGDDAGLLGAAYAALECSL
ncbi:ROK family protein [Solirubrobacter soli]|uniref:ROK family protein n=1 Tax=Solirubrobacter soli TaxID=363832 RepID=UPI0004252CF1|nr:ROK family protein [Solirubrobacter soli]